MLLVLVPAMLYACRMHQRLAPTAIIATAALLIGASCGGPNPSATAVVSTASPLAPAALVLEVAALPRVSLDPAANTAVCDPEPASANLDAGETTIFCRDSLELAVRALTAAGFAPIQRLYLHRPVCAATPCSANELNAAIVVGWTASGPSSVAIDARSSLVRVTTPDPSIAWPATGTSTAPAVDRPEIAGAPAEIAQRTPYPFCGHADMGQPASVEGCFRDAVLAGRPAELLERVFSTEGDPVDWLDRFDGLGAVVRYASESGGWTRQAGSMIVYADPNAWSFDPWPETTTVIAKP